MCNHGNRKKIGAVWVCVNCGLTILPDGKVFFDRELPNYNSKHKPKRKKGRKAVKDK